RPPANAMDRQLLGDVVAAHEQLAAEDPAAVVITGREGFFSAGADLKLAPTLDAEAQAAMVDQINRMAAGWYGFPRPVVCAVNGHAIAGGMVLALCGDHRVAGPAGRFGLTEVRAGIPYPALAIAVVRAELSPPAARELVLRGELWDAGAARERGLLDEVVEQAEVLDRSLEVAGELAALPAQTYAYVKAQLRAPVIAESRRVLDGGSDPLAGAWVGGETAGAAAAVLRGDGD
ncbi:MAG TPA: enoyl-CoA hydratase/isomerase family protein, partial [Solirubrobacteraceae bacterium]|nr:enoyl-CoA hydratase/isomerase family protein [Solirubrobacteraceae bacterium]